MQEYIVYKHTTPSGKVYIGITNQVPKKRWGLSGQGYKSNVHFWNAIVKYGWNNISHEILFSGLSKEEACRIEKRLISEYESNNSAHGYNLTDGGEHYEFSVEVIKKISRPKNLSEETRAEMSRRGRAQYDKTLRGRVNTPEQIEKMANTKRGQKQPQDVIEKRRNSLKKYYQEHTVSDATRKKLSAVMKGKRRGDEFKAKMRICHSPENNHRSRAVNQIMDGVVINTFCSTREAERQTGINYTSIARACAGVRLKKQAAMNGSMFRERVC